MKLKSNNELAFDLTNLLLVTIFFLIILFPLIFMVVASVSDPQQVATGHVFLIPKGFTLQGYQRVFKYTQLWVGYRNTIFYTLAGTLISLFLTLTAAYPLSRKDFVGKNFFLIMFTITMFFSGGLIPTYMTVKALGMRDTIWAQIIPNALAFWYIVIVRTFYQGIPQELLEAAKIDGCSNTKQFTRILLPLSKPIIAVMALFYGVEQWNSFFSALIYISKQGLMPLQVILRQILIVNQIDKSVVMDEANRMLISQQHQIVSLIKYAAIIVSTLPIIMIYPFLQKYFVGGIMVGAIKG